MTCGDFLSKIKAILFDSGRVLNGPVPGHWFITPNFWNYVDKTVFESIESSKIHFAFRKADEYINTQKLITTKEFELECFIKFYEIFSNSLPELKLTNDKINLIANDLIYNPDKYVFYDDALKVIPELSKRYKLGIVSDAWPSLLDVYDKNNFTQYFDSIIISLYSSLTSLIISNSSGAISLFSMAINLFMISSSGNDFLAINSFSPLNAKNPLMQ